jgi:hypothetical protein
MIKKAYLLPFFALFGLFSSQLKAQLYNVDVEKVKTVRGLTAVLRNNPADSACTIMGFNLFVLPTKGDPYQAKALGKGCAGDMKAHLEQLQVGDRMQFSNVLIQCKNEPAAHEITSISLSLK